jgi:hypothetical protein
LIPNDIWKFLLDFTDNTTRCITKCVSRLFYGLSKRYNIFFIKDFYDTKDLALWALQCWTSPKNKFKLYRLVKFKDLDLIIYALNLGCKWNNKVALEAAAHNCIDLLEYAHNNDQYYNSYVPGVAARHGHLLCLQFLFSIDCYFGYDVLVNAIIGNHLECFKYAWLKGCSCNDKVVVLAMDYGRFEILKFICDKVPTALERKRISLNNVDNLLLCDNIEYIQFLVKHGILWHPNVCTDLARIGAFLSLQYVRQHCCKWNEHVYLEATINGHIDILKYAYNHQCPMSYKVYNAILKLPTSQCTIFIFNKFNYKYC